MIEPGPDDTAGSARDTLEALGDLVQAVEATRSRLEKRRLLVEYLRGLADAALGLAVTYLAGRPFPRADKRRLSVGGATLVRALHEAAPALTPEAIAAAWQRHRDAGDMAAEVWSAAPVAKGPPLALAEVARLLDELYRARGVAAKTALLAGGFRRMRPAGLRAFVKVLLGETRAGMQESVVEDAVAHLTGQALEAVRAANRHRADLGAVAREARAGGLVLPRFSYFTPIDPMLAQPAADSREVTRRLGVPVWVEDKYDGVRCQLHKAAAVVRLYSRDRHDITAQFPDVIEAFAAGDERYALDGELMAVQGERTLPFARLQPRLSRVRPGPEVVSAHPAGLVAFDLLALGDEPLLDAPLDTRRARLDALSLPPGQRLAPLASAASAADLEALFEAARGRGNEGLMCKQPGSPYASGRRGYHWLKLKRPLDTLDVVVVGAEWGHGKRRDVLSDYTFAVRVPATGELLTIGKAYGGLTDAEIRELTDRLRALTIHDTGHYRTVRPEIVLEVAFNDIRRSTRHRSGYALRFPRIVRVRQDRTAVDISTVGDVERLHEALGTEPDGPDPEGPP